mmetsp:Transcript_19369/g.39825  ORF Transcript_19369/g.39825 Transcript_19369/m.39825 type:complete len:135 (+) Transcript_19369:794-1198(+)
MTGPQCITKAGCGNFCGNFMDPTSYTKSYRKLSKKWNVEDFPIWITALDLNHWWNLQMETRMRRENPAVGHIFSEDVSGGVFERIAEVPNQNHQLEVAAVPPNKSISLQRSTASDRNEAYNRRGRTAGDMMILL